jgi:hypothetical protein
MLVGGGCVTGVGVSWATVVEALLGPGVAAAAWVSGCAVPTGDGVDEVARQAADRTATSSKAVVTLGLTFTSLAMGDCDVLS